MVFVFNPSVFFKEFVSKKLPRLELHLLAFFFQPAWLRLLLAYGVRIITFRETYM